MQQPMVFNAQSSNPPVLCWGREKQVHIVRWERNRKFPTAVRLKVSFESLNKSKADVEKTTGSMEKHSTHLILLILFGIFPDKNQLLMKYLNLEVQYGWASSPRCHGSEMRGALKLWFPFLFLIIQCGLQWYLQNSVLITDCMAGGVCVVLYNT